MEEQQRTVLVIERDWRIRWLVRANLEVLSYRVQEALNAGHALERMRDLRPHLVLVEPDSLDMGVVPFLGALGSQKPGQPPPVIVMSAEPPERQCLSHNLTASYLKKPFSAAALMEQVRQALGADLCSVSQAGADEEP